MVYHTAWDPIPYVSTHAHGRGQRRAKRTGSCARKDEQVREQEHLQRSVAREGIGRGAVVLPRWL